MKPAKTRKKVVISVDPALHKRLKKRAINDGVPLRQLVDRGLRLQLASRNAAAQESNEKLSQP